LANVNELCCRLTGDAAIRRRCRLTGDAAIRRRIAFKGYTVRGRPDWFVRIAIRNGPVGLSSGDEERGLFRTRAKRRA
jgi:hypothetical protein